MIAGMIFLGFQLSQCSLISDFGAGKSLRSVKRSVDCLIVRQSTEYRLTGRRPGGQWWRGLYAFFTPFPEFLFLFTLDVSGETTWLQQNSLSRTGNALSVIKAYDKYSQSKQRYGCNLSFLSTLSIRKHYIACNLCTIKCGACGIGLVTWLAAPLILATRETSPSSCLIGHQSSVLVSHWLRELTSL